MTLIDRFINKFSDFVFSSDNDSPFQRITLDANETVVSQEIIGNFEPIVRMAVLQTTDDNFCPVPTNILVVPRGDLIYAFLELKRELTILRQSRPAVFLWRNIR